MLHLRRLSVYIKMANNLVGFHDRKQRYFLSRQPVLNVHNELSYPLTKDETFFYVRNVLEIQSPEEMLKSDREAFLAKLMRQMKRKTPFTNIPFISTKYGASLFSLPQCKEAMVSLTGGHCVVINSFLKAVLDNFGFQTYQIKGNIYRWRQPLIDLHLAVIVENLTHKGSKHLADLGNQYELCTPVSLDFRCVSPVYKGRQEAYRYFQLSHGIVVFCKEINENNIKPGKFQQIFNEDGRFWEALTTLKTLTEASFSDALLINKMALSEGIEEVIGLRSDLLLVGFHGELMIRISRKSCAIVAANGKLERKKIVNDDELTSMIVKYFPQFCDKEVNNIISHLNMKQTSHGRQF